jgi:toxin ParE1/3/4
MKIEKSQRFVGELKAIATFIAEDKKGAAKEFVKGLQRAIDSLPDNPYKCRKSIYFEDENTRDLIYGGYVVVYLIGVERNAIIVLGIVNRNLWQ